MMNPRFLSLVPVGLVCFLGLGPLQPSLAGPRVDLHEGAYSESFTDLAPPIGVSELSLTRIYHSRSDHLGLFGYGWCSAFEDKIEPAGPTGWTISECGGPKEWAVFYQLKTGEWINEVDPTDHLVRVSKRLIRTRPSARQSIFDEASGQILGWRNGRGEAIQVKIGPHFRPTGLSSSFGRSIQFAIDPLTGLISGAIDHLGHEISYRHSGIDLVEVKDRKQTTWMYRYDHLHNLITARHLGAKWVINRYESASDRLISHREFSGDHPGCLETYAYENSVVANGELARVDISRVCPHRRATNSRLEISFQVGKNQTRKIDEIRRTENGTTTRFRINQEGGALVRN